MYDKMKKVKEWKEYVWLVKEEKEWKKSTLWLGDN